MRPLNRTSTIWSPELAYCIGLIASDGFLSNDRRHVTLVSKDLDQIETFRQYLGITAKVGKHGRGGSLEKRYYHVQFGDVVFYRFLISIGLTPAKSKTLSAINVPEIYFRDFLRGSFDGDGTFYSYWDKRWRSSFLFYIGFISASLSHLEWIRSNLIKAINVHGHISTSVNNRAFCLRFAKDEAKKIINFMYYHPDLPYLERKYKKVYTALDIDENNRDARVL